LRIRGVVALHVRMDVQRSDLRRLLMDELRDVALVSFALMKHIGHGWRLEEARQPRIHLMALAPVGLDMRTEPLCDIGELYAR